MINFQSQLTDGSGDPVPDGDYDVVFKIFDDAVGGTLWWTEAQTVTAVNGNIEVVLGAMVPIPPGAIADVTEGNENLYRYLEIKVEADSPMTPRTMLMAVPYAVAAERMIGDVTTMPGMLYLYPSAAGGGAAVESGGQPLIAPYRLQATPNGGSLSINYPYSVSTSGGDSSSNFILSKSLGHGIAMKVEAGSQMISIDKSPTQTGVLFFADSTKGKVGLNQLTNAYGIGLEAQPSEIRFEGNIEGIPSNQRRWLMRAGSTFSEFAMYEPPDSTNPGVEVEVDENSRRFLLSKDALKRALDLSMDSTDTRLQLLDSSTACQNKILLKVDSATAQVHIQSENCDAAGGGLANIVLRTGTLGPQVGIGVLNPLHALHVNGSICATGSIGACSDIRYKKDVQPIEDGLSKVVQLEGITYNWRTEEYPDMDFTTQRQVGVVAQDVEKVLPEAVLTDREGYKSVDYARLTALLIEAIKDQQQTIAEQAKSIRILQNDMAKIKGTLTQRSEGMGDMSSAGTTR